jgi:predicted nucleic acid-binding Zn finger protein
LLNEGSGQKQDFVLRTHLHVLQESKDFTSFSYGCKRSKIFGKIQVSMALFLSSKICQGDDLFYSVQSRGKQCAFMSLSALLTAHFIPLIN